MLSSLHRSLQTAKGKVDSELRSLCKDINRKLANSLSSRHLASAASAPSLQIPHATSQTSIASSTSSVTTESERPAGGTATSPYSGLVLQIPPLSPEGAVAAAQAFVDAPTPASNLPASWEEGVIKLRDLAERCISTSAEEFTNSCKSIVEDLNAARERMPAGTEKQLLMKMLFVLTRYQRLLEIQQEENESQAEVDASDAGDPSVRVKHRRKNSFVERIGRPEGGLLEGSAARDFGSQTCKRKPMETEQGQMTLGPVIENLSLPLGPITRWDSCPPPADLILKPKQEGPKILPVIESDTDSDNLTPTKAGLQGDLHDPAVMTTWMGGEKIRHTQSSDSIPHGFATPRSSVPHVTSANGSFSGPLLGSDKGGGLGKKKSGLIGGVTNLVRMLSGKLEDLLASVKEEDEEHAREEEEGKKESKAEGKARDKAHEKGKDKSKSKDRDGKAPSKQGPASTAQPSTPAAQEGGKEAAVAPSVGKSKDKGGQRAKDAVTPSGDGKGKGREKAGGLWRQSSGSMAIPSCFSSDTLVSERDGERGGGGGGGAGSSIQWGPACPLSRPHVPCC